MFKKLALVAMLFNVHPTFSFSMSDLSSMNELCKKCMMFCKPHHDSFTEISTVLAQTPTFLQPFALLKHYPKTSLISAGIAALITWKLIPEKKLSKNTQLKEKTIPSRNNTLRNISIAGLVGITGALVTAYCVKRLEQIASNHYADLAMATILITRIEKHPAVTFYNNLPSGITNRLESIVKYLFSK